MLRISTLTRNTIYFFFALMLTFSACKDDPPSQLLEQAESIIIRDNGNQGNASDIEINYDQFGLDQIEHYRIYIVKAPLVASQAIDFLQGLSDEHYVDAAPNEIIPTKGKRLPVGMLDSDGEEITTGVRYRAAVISLPLDASTYLPILAHSENEVELSQNNLVSDFTPQLESGSGSLAMTAEGKLVLATYNILGDLSPEFDPFAPVVDISKSGSVAASATQFSYLGGVAVDASGQIYLSNTSQGELLKMTATDQFEVLLHEGTELKEPEGIFNDGQGNLFVADRSTGSIIKIDANGVSSFYASAGPDVRGLTGDDSGNLYASLNNQDGRIIKIDANGATSVLANIPTFVPPDYRLRFIMWLGQVAYHEGAIYAAGTSTHRIYKVTENGEVSVFAGSGELLLPYGDALTAHFNRPMGLAFSEDGNTLFVSGCEDIVPQHTQASYPSRVYRIDLAE